MNHRNTRYLVILACSLLLSCSDTNKDDSSDKGGEQLQQQHEMLSHKNLLARQSMSSSILTDFTTDGCSGGLSIGWERLAEQFDGIRERHGIHPPWEACCIVHDKLYHKGAATNATTEESFEARKQADLALLTCVVQTGNTRTAKLSSEYDISPEAVHTLYSTIAELMYRAVRIGGTPCTGLPWRWGYGWPECSQDKKDFLTGVEN